MATDEDVANDYDSPWKLALTGFFRPLLELCFPRIATELDWGRGIEFLDTELHEILRESAEGRQQVDKLARVYLEDGTTRRILVHVEVQHWPERDFEKRLFSYYTRLTQKGEPVVTAAILADTDPKWRPARYENEMLGCGVRFDFPVCKLLDLLERREELERSQSPAAVLVLANWASQKMGLHDRERFGWKMRLMRSLYEKGFGRDHIVELYRLIDWLLELPAGAEQEFRTKIIQYDQENIMPYVTSIERLAKAEGRQEGRQEGLEAGLRTMREMIKDTLLARFGSVPEKLERSLETEISVEQLRAIHRKAVNCGRLEDFEEHQ